MKTSAKKTYVAPEMEILELKYEGVLCGSDPDSAYREGYGSAYELN